MNTNPLISIIIPSYNTSDYIAEMLACVNKQTYKNIEVIVVDDGSTDNTVEIVKKCIWVDKLIQLRHKGVSTARNVGIEQATGEKIFFWDSDDSMEPTTVEECVDFAKKHNVKAVLYGYADKINGIICKPQMHYLNAVYRDREIQIELMPHFLGHSFDDINNWIRGHQGLRQGKEHTALWRIMLDANTIKENNIKFDTKLSLGEDTSFINQYMLYETSIGFLNKSLYYLTIRQTGANLSSLNNPIKRLDDKLKLISVRNEIDKKAMQLYGIETHSYWEGTLVLSVIEMAMRLSTNKEKHFRQNYQLLENFISNETVRQAIKEFRPSSKLKFKAIPFYFIKYRGCKILFLLFALLPNKIISKVINC